MIAKRPGEAHECIKVRLARYTYFQAPCHNGDSQACGSPTTPNSAAVVAPSAGRQPPALVRRGGDTPPSCSDRLGGMESWPHSYPCGARCCPSEYIGRRKEN